MKKKGLIWLMLVLVFMVIGLPVMAEEVLVPVTKLGLAPWLGEIKDENDLAKKFAREKAYFAGYIQYDLKEAAKLEISLAEANGIVNSMESAMEGVKETSVPDETVFKSMGWKSKKGQVMRTKNPILKLGKSTKGFPVKVDFKDYEIEYVFLKDCGNLCLRDVKVEIPPKAEYVPQPKEEVPPPKTETPPPRYVEPPPPPPEVYVYYYPPPPPPPQYYGRPDWSWSITFPFFFYYEDRYYHHDYQPRDYQPRYYQPRHYQPRHYQPRYYQSRYYQPRHYQPRVRPPTVHTRPPVHSTPRVRPPGVQTR